MGGGELGPREPAAELATARAVPGMPALRAVPEACLAVKQFPARFFFGGGCGLRAALIGRLDMGAANPKIVKDVVDILLGKIGPVGHALMFELLEQRGGGRIAGFDHRRRLMNEFEQPVMPATVVDSLQIGADFNSPAIGMSRAAALRKCQPGFW